MRRKRTSVVFRIFRYLILILILCGAGYGVYYYYGHIINKAYEAPLNPVQIEKAEKRVLSESFTITGYVEAEAMVPVVPFVSGTLKEYHAKAGALVKEGDLLAVVDPEPYALQSKQAEAAYLAYEATFKRVSALYESGAATKQNYDEVKAQRDAYQAQYDLAKVQLGYAYVKSPVSGTILIADQAVGSVGTSTIPVAVIADLNNLVMNIKVPESYFSEITKNQETLRIRVYRTVDGKTDSSDTEILSIAPYVDAASKTFALKVKLLSPEAFRPGMFVKAEIVTVEEEVLSLPQKAKRLDGSVYYVDEDEVGTRVVHLYSFPSGLENNEYFQIPEEDMDKVFVVRGQNNIINGMAVNVVEGY